MALLDADLAILGSDPASYDRYRLAVRREYAHIDELAWRTGRRTRWETAAKSNIARELGTFDTPA